MRKQSTRELVVLSLLFATSITLFNIWFADGDIITAATMAPVYFVVIFATMRLSNSVGRRIMNRFWPPTAPVAPSEPLAPRSERPEHARRRRDRRRDQRRGRRRN